MISLSRHGLVQYPSHSDRNGVRKGAYVFIEEHNADVTLIGTGSEMFFAVDTRTELAAMGVKARVVSFPCQRLFEEQTLEYKEEVMRYSTSKPIVIIEAYAVNGWERYADAGYSMRTFGKSLPPEKEVYSFFGFQADVIARSVRQFLDDVEVSGIKSLRGRLRDLNNGPMGHGFEPL